MQSLLLNKEKNKFKEPQCVGSEPGAAEGTCTDSKGDLTHFPADVVIKADMLFPSVKNTSLPGAKSD